jgi:amino-acid N-acetyltransferase
MGASERSQRRFVEFFRRASPYVENHRGGTFVIILPGIVMEDNQRLESLFKVKPSLN